MVETCDRLTAADERQSGLRQLNDFSSDSFDLMFSDCQFVGLHVHF